MTIYTFYARDYTGKARIEGTLDIEKQEYGGPNPDACRRTVESCVTIDPTKEEDLFRVFGRGSRFWIAKGEPHKTGRPLKKGEEDIPAVKRTPKMRFSRSDESNT